MKRPLALFALVALVSATAIATPASARPGIVGFSGRPFNGSDETCTSCHGGAVPPTLELSTPKTIGAGQTGHVELVVAGVGARTSINASLSDGVRAVAGKNTQIPIPLDAPNEIAASLPLVSGATATYTFDFVAPETNGTISLWVAAMSANGSGTGGDGVTTAVQTIVVTGGTDPTDAERGAATPVHAVDPFGGGKGRSTGGASGAPTKVEPPLPEPTSKVGAPGGLPGDGAGGCSFAPRDLGTSLGGTLSTLALFAIAAARRRYLYRKPSPLAWRCGSVFPIGRPGRPRLPRAASTRCARRCWWPTSPDIAVTLSLRTRTSRADAPTRDSRSDPLS